MEVLLKLSICLLAVVQFNVHFVEAKKTTALCYMVAWASKRAEQGQFTIQDADTEHCTHVVYAFMTINNNTGIIESVDPLLDLEEGGKGKAQLKELKTLKTSNKDIKILASIGGYSQGSVRFSDMARSSTLKTAFINSLIKFISQYELDGIDICWQFPGLNGGKADDRRNFVNLLKDIKAVFEPQGWILTIHMIAKSYIIPHGFDVRSISEVVDYINLAAVEYHGPWDRNTGIMAPLNSTNDNNVASMVNYVLKRGATPSKILLGLPTYGHAYVTKDKIQSDNYIGLFSDQAYTSPWTTEPGIIAYNEICTNLKNDKTWTEVFDKNSSTPIAYKDRIFVSFDNQRSLIEKAKLVISQKLGGIMLWSLDMDDFRGLCHDKRYPLLSAVTEFLDKNVEEAPPQENHKLGTTLPEVTSLSSSTTLPEVTSPNSGGHQVYKIQVVNIVIVMSLFYVYTFF